MTLLQTKCIEVISFGLSKTSIERQIAQDSKKFQNVKATTTNIPCGEEIQENPSWILCKQMNKIASIPGYNYIFHCS